MPIQQNPKNRPNRPIYVTHIDEQKFNAVQDFVFAPLIYVFLFFAIGIFGIALLLLIYAVA